MLSMKKKGLLSSAMLSLALISAPQAFADPDNKTLIIEGVEIPTDVAAPAGSPFERLYSGWRFRSPETQALQTDDFDNPAFAPVEIGNDLWNEVDGTEGKSCATCHGDAAESMKGVRASMPKWSEKAGKPQALENHINSCRTDRMGADKWKWEAGDMLAMTAYIGVQSRGMPVSVKTDGPMQPWLAKGKDLYYTRIGQLDLACASCHEANFGMKIRSDHLSQGQVNGFPVYRLKWGGLGSIHRRFKGCMDQVRAKPYKRGSDEFLALELYVASRGAGLAVETPAVRN